MPDTHEQVKACATLMMILAYEDLPECHWIVFTEFGIEGSIVNREDDDDLYALQMYAQKFGTGVRIDYSHHTGYTVGTYNGTPVRVTGKVRDHA